MCNLTDTRIHRKSYTGYKRVLIVDGRYFSPAMGIEYKEGMNLPILFPSDVVDKKIYMYSEFIPACDILNFASEKRMQGRTAVYTKLKTAHSDMGIGESIIKMTISKHLLKGSYSAYDVVAGKHIDKIEPLTEEELESIGNPEFEKPKLLISIL